MEDLKMYILINKDLDYSDHNMYLKMMAQVGHAVGIYEKNLRDTDSVLYEKYYTGRVKKIILPCKQSKLEELESQGYLAIRDAGFTLLSPNTLTCVNIDILDYSNLPVEYKWLTKLRLSIT